jgi:F-type H+-transporting ATPase subunit gamma
MAKARGVLNSANPYFSLMRRAIGDILHASPDYEHPVFEGNRALKSALIMVIANDRGLCGGYNANISRLAANLAVSLSEEGKEVSFLTIGNKARDFFRRAGGHIVEHFSGISEKPTIEDAREIMPVVMDLYNTGKIDEVYIAYTEFKSAITYVPKTLRILPVAIQDFPAEEDRNYSVMQFEPSAHEVLSFIVPKFLGTTLFECLITSAASGQGATMTAMDSATENAENIIDNLTLILNRVRQAAITQEISEIVGGANALE